jgi:DNA polymerase V
MRAEHLSCRYISVYLMTNAWAEGDQYFNQLTAQLPHPTAFLPEITATANELLKRIYRPNYKYRKVMIGLTGLTNDQNPQLDLFDDHYNYLKQIAPLMEVFDHINDRYGRGTIKLACGLGSNPDDTEPWQMKRDYLSPSYTTNINEIPVVY